MSRTEPLRACFITPVPPDEYSGATLHAMWLARELENHGVHVDFLAYRGENPSPPGTVEGLPFRYVDRRPGRFGELRFWPELGRVLARGSYDIVHSHSAGFVEAFVGPAGRLARFGSVATIMLEGSDLRTAGRLGLPLHRAMLRLVDRVVALTRETRDEARAMGVADSRLDIIPISVDVRRFHPPRNGERATARRMLDLPADAPVVAFVGALNARKNVIWLLDAWRNRPSSLANAHLLVVGDVTGHPEGPAVRAAVRHAVAEWGPRAIRWIPFVKEIEQVYTAADVLVLPSHSEGLPTVMLQAMATGVPPVVTPFSGAREVVGEGNERGEVFDFDDQQRLYGALDRFLNNEVERARAGREARRLIESRFSMAGVAARYRELYDSVRRRSR